MNLLFYSRGYFDRRIQIYLWHESSTIESVLFSNDTNGTEDRSMSTAVPTLLEPSVIRIVPFSVVVVVSFHVDTDQ